MIEIKSERLTAAEYIGFLARTDLGSQYPRERFETRIPKLLENASVSLAARNEDGLLVGVLLGLTAFFFILLGRGEKVFGALRNLAKLLHRWKLLHNLDSALSRLDKAQRDHELCAELMRGKTGMLFGAFFLNFLQRVSRIAVPMFTYMALGGIGRLAPRVFASQCFVTIGYNCVPVPGGMGVADYLMVDGFSDLMAFDDAIHLEVLSRSISFYICVAVSGVIVLIGSLIQRKRRR